MSLTGVTREVYPTQEHPAYTGIPRKACAACTDRTGRAAAIRAALVR